MSAKKRAAIKRQQTAILGIILTLFGLVGLYDLLSAPTGRHFLLSFLGVGAWPLVIGLMALGISMLLWPTLKARIGGYWFAEALLGVILLYLAGVIIASLLIHAKDPFLASLNGQGGGLVGWALASSLLMYLGLLPTWAFLFAMIIGGLYLLYAYTPMRLLALPGVSVKWVPPPAPAPEPQIAPKSARTKTAPQQSKTRYAKSAKSKETVENKPEKRPKSPKIAKKQQKKPKKPKKQPKTASRTSKRTKKPAAGRQHARNLPPLGLLTKTDEEDAPLEQAQIMANIIEDTLASFDIPARVVKINVGPTVTQFGVQPGTYERSGKVVRVRINKIVALADDIALALAASPVRIEAPVPGESYIGIEVPNREPTLVSLRGLLGDPAFQKNGSSLPLPLGRDVSGEAVIADLHKLPHLLIAGATGSGKSVAMNAIICGLLFNHTPDQIKLLMVDPKRVEFPGYNGTPHLLAPVVTDPEEASGALSWLLVEMDDRYRKFSETGVRNIGAYNKKAPPGQQLPYIIMLVDELADLMMTSPEIIEAKLVRLAQMARATGIHLVIATQRPSVDVVTGLIKANFPARLAFAVSSQIDSRVILDEPGAEKLLGRGDGIFMAPDSPLLRRVQGCYVSDSEIQALVGWWRAHVPQKPHSPTRARYPWTDMMVEEANADDMFYQAVEALRGRQSISASALQRLMNIGYPKAARLLEQLEAEGVVGPEEDNRAGRRVLLDD